MSVLQFDVGINYFQRELMKHGVIRLTFIVMHVCSYDSVPFYFDIFVKDT